MLYGQKAQALPEHVRLLHTMKFDQLLVLRHPQGKKDGKSYVMERRSAADNGFEITDKQGTPASIFCNYGL